MEELGQGQVAVAPGQPAPPPVADFTNVPTLSDADVRRAIAEAESKGIDPDKLTVSEMAELQSGTPTKVAESARISPDQVVNPNAVRLEVPDQFRNPDGEPNVEKIKDATRQLDEATQKKDAQIEKSVEDYLREYKEKQTKFRNTPNPEKFAERLRSQEPAPSVTGLSDQQLREMIMNDYRIDPISTTTQLIEAAVQRHLEPFSEEKRERALRANVEALAKDDPRILNDRVYSAINKELEGNPELWKLANPHRAAWLEVKERLRLGEPTRSAQAPSSRPPSPVLGAGAPPSAPSPSDYRVAPKSALETLDIRDKKQEAMGDEMLRRALERKTY